MEKLAKLLQEANVGKVVLGEALANHTTMKIGGPADLFVEPSSVEGLERTMKLVREQGVNWRAIGRGSNLLVSDQGIEGVVIKLGDGMDSLEVNGTEVVVEGGYPLIKLATVLSRKGLAGLEFAGGIPGSLGGAVYMNAGAHMSDMSKIVEKAYVLFEDGTFEWLTNEDLKFSYRTSVLQKERPGICVKAVLQLKEGQTEEIKSQLQKNKDYRRETQPWNFPCAGSIFRNPLPEYAGQLIEKAGLKGYQIGGAQVSEMHANFIVNKENATAADVLNLIQHIKSEIKEKFNVDMHTEIEIIGRK
ncbi:UDP-N-acetylmuramate dehydrogenase [Bacillus mesophilus]|uniref:UDP-N-acetylenolpyruvoylglucosamine reductase n=1 Tax=Bacillus mesophilus TaxID=1808955 RepID=A0A6M0Q243_9BACI|nr:UDP-N-acetylmuramate dehydrogenase [Bacillus mesophilus]MBM7659454.1 UDP-N-acetylmuramate dehydrogenase [Bacillus mesophilus]NEY70327.1 UDP-N-acetylmuramate dehydrogenase [Bacillus mesophilus]